jgi:hypothetical protein
MERQVQWAKALVQRARQHPFQYLSKQSLMKEQIRQIGHRLERSHAFDLPALVAEGKRKLGRRREPLKGICQ